MTKVKGMSEKFNKLWQAAEHLLQQAEHEDVAHTKDMIKAVLQCIKILKFNLDIFLPLAILHNIERITVLEEHFNDVIIDVNAPSNIFQHQPY